MSSVVCSYCNTNQDLFSYELTCDKCKNLICIKCRKHLYKIKDQISKL